MKLRTPLWQSLRRDEIAAASDAGAAVLLPVGSIEQHGDHLPVNTDIAIATAVCVRASEISESPSAVVAPAVLVGILAPSHELARDPDARPEYPPGFDLRGMSRNMASRLPQDTDSQRAWR